jgi:hypothetical protein
MSAEKILDTGIKNLPHLETSQKGEEVISGRVDINVLLNRAKKVKDKETRTNLVFLGLILSLIFVVTLILSF